MQTERVNRVLVVCDDAEIRTWLGDILGEEFAIEFEHDGLVGLNRALDEVYDVLIAWEVSLGVDVLEFLQQLRKESRTPMLVLTPESDAANRVRVLEAGADEYLAASG